MTNYHFKQKNPEEIGKHIIHALKEKSTKRYCNSKYLYTKHKFRNTTRYNHILTSEIAADFNISLLPRPRSSRQKLSRETLDLSVVRNQVDLTDTFKTFDSSTNEYTFFSAAHGHFSKIEHILGHKASLNRYRNTEIAPASRLNTMDYSCPVLTKGTAGSISTHENGTIYY